jgi:hypothetical protein
MALQAFDSEREALGDRMINGLSPQVREAMLALTAIVRAWKVRDPERLNIAIRRGAKARRAYIDYLIECEERGL